MMYDISVWEGIRARVEWEISGFEKSIKSEISRDRSLQEHYGIYPVPWQLGEVLWQRANGWIQRLYRECCNVYGKETSLEFDQAVWAYLIEPLIYCTTAGCSNAPREAVAPNRLATTGGDRIKHSQQPQMAIPLAAFEVILRKKWTFVHDV